MIESLASMDLLEPASRFALLVLRCVGLVTFCPILGSSILPVRVRLAVAWTIALLLFPGAGNWSVLPQQPVDWAVAGVRELAVGFGLGLAARVLFDGLEGAARLLAGQSGFALSSMLDPLTGSESVTPALFQNLLATSLFLAADLHHLFIKGLQHSYEVLPPGIDMPETAALADAVGALGARIFSVAVELAAPALVVTVAVDLVLILVGRALPQVPILLVGYPVKMAVGLVGMVILISATGAAIGWIGRVFASDGAALVAAFAGSSS